MRLLLLVYLGLFFLPLAEAFVYPGVLHNYFHLSPFVFVLAATGLGILIHWQLPSQWWHKIGIGAVYGLAPIVTLVALVLRAIELLTHPNFIYVNLHVEPVQFGMFGLYAALMGLPLLTLKFVREHWKSTLFVISILLLQLLRLYWISPELFYIWNQEDNIVEYLTVVFFLVAGTFTLTSLPHLTHFKFTRPQTRFLQALLITIALGFFVISAEEISWGQRLLGIGTPEVIMKDNIQNEITIHNNAFIFKYVYIAYFLVNLYGLTSWIGYTVLAPRLTGFPQLLVRLLTTRWYLMLLFVPNLGYCLLRFIYGNVFLDQWEEFTELYLALAAALVAALNWRYLKHRLAS